MSADGLRRRVSELAGLLRGLARWRFGASREMKWEGGQRHAGAGRAVARLRRVPLGAQDTILPHIGWVLTLEAASVC